MRLSFLPLILMALLAAPRLRADDAPPVPPCSSTAELPLDDIPRSRLGDPRRTEKSQAGTNPLQIKFIGVTANSTDLVILVRTHDSLDKFWAYAERRRAAGAPLRTGENTPLRGLNLQFIAYPGGRPDEAFRGAVWLEYEKAGEPEPKTLIQKDNAAGAGFGFPAMDFDGGLQASIATPVDVLLNLNEVEIRMPLKSFAFQTGDEVKVRFRQGEVTVCVPQ